MADTAAFGSLPEPGRDLILSMSRRRTYEPGDVLVRQGDEATSLYLVESGRVAVRFATPMGDVVTLAVMGTGAVFGELGIIIPRRERTATVTAIDRVTAHTVRQEDFSRLRRDHRAVDEFLMLAMARQIDRLSRLVAEVLYVPVDRRVARRLFEVARVFADGGRPIVLPLTQEDLAHLAGTTRPTVNQALKKFERLGVVEVARGQVRVLDLPELRNRGAW
jgi:CRP-like cAMP-binding protein